MLKKIQNFPQNGKSNKKLCLKTPHNENFPLSQAIHFNVTANEKSMIHLTLRLPWCFTFSRKTLSEKSQMWVNSFAFDYFPCFLLPINAQIQTERLPHEKWFLCNLRERNETQTCAVGVHWGVAWKWIPSLKKLVLLMLGKISIWL